MFLKNRFEKLRNIFQQVLNSNEILVVETYLCKLLNMWPEDNLLNCKLVFLVFSFSIGILIPSVSFESLHKNIDDKSNKAFVPRHCTWSIRRKISLTTLWLSANVYYFICFKLKFFNF